MVWIEHGIRTKIASTFLGKIFKSIIWVSSSKSIHFLSLNIRIQKLSVIGSILLNILTTCIKETKCKYTFNLQIIQNQGGILKTWKNKVFQNIGS